MSVDKVQKNVDSTGRSLDRLKEALAEPPSNPLAIDGTIRRFEFCFELFWKAFQAILWHDGIECRTPREALSRANQVGLIDDETAWLGMLQARNQASHTYDEFVAKMVYGDISRHLHALESAQASLLKRLHGQTQ